MSGGLHHHLHVEEKVVGVPFTEVLHFVHHGVQPGLLFLKVVLQDQHASLHDLVTLSELLVPDRRRRRRRWRRREVEECV